MTFVTYQLQVDEGDHPGDRQDVLHARLIRVASSEHSGGKFIMCLRHYTMDLVIVLIMYTGDACIKMTRKKEGHAKGKP